MSPFRLKQPFQASGRAIRASIGSKNVASMSWVMEQVQNCKGHVKKSVEWLMTGGLVIFGLWLLCYLGIWAVGLYKSLDNSGWIAHDRDTPVWIQRDWQVGEYRVCDMFVKSPRLFCGMDNKQGLSIDQFPENVTDDDLAKALSAVTAEVTPNSKTDWSSLEGYFHVLPVKYFGRLERPGKWRITWRCQRNSDSLTCKALD